MKENRFLKVLIILFGISIIFYRFSNLNADLTGESFSNIPCLWIGDEAWNSGNAIHKYLTNEWMCNYYNHIIISPIMPLIQYYFFNLFGLSTITVRMPSVVISLLLIFVGILFFNIKFNTGNDKTLKYIVLFIYLFLIGTNKDFYIFSKLAFIDIPMIFFGTLSLFAISLALKVKKYRNKIILSSLSGISLALSILTKASGIQFVFIFALFTLFYFFIFNDQKRSNILLILFAVFLGGI